jgi:rhodanese-related sulfurtransferase
VKLLLIVLAVAAVLFIAQKFFGGEVLKPEDAARRVAAGAILIDVRELDEWRAGVVQGALLLPLSDLQGERVQWGPILKPYRAKELIIYCHSGTRSGIAARQLAGEGLTTFNAGGFSFWKNAGHPIVSPPSTALR